MLLRDVVEQTSWPEVKSALLWSYPDASDSLAGYRKVLEQLRRLDPSSSNMRIIVEEATESFGDEDSRYTSVYGKDGTKNHELEDFDAGGGNPDSEFADSEAKFGLSFHKREEWLGMRIDPISLSSYTASQIVAHCLWDMTFHGFEQMEVDATLEELNRRVAELKDLSEKEREKRLVPAEEVFRRLRERIDT